MILLFLLLSLFLLLVGHLFRLLRWEQFIRIYERPARGSLLRGMAGGYAVNFLLPFHVGDVLRAVYTGRQMRSGVGFALATVIMDRFLDVWVVALLYGLCRVFGLGGAGIAAGAQYYFRFALLLVVALVAVVLARDILKRVCLALCGLFNEKIRLAGLEFGWSLINTFKDLGRVRLSRLALNTIWMWAAYLGSYWALGQSLSLCGGSFSAMDVFDMLFGTKSVDVTSFGVTGGLHRVSPVAQAVMLLWFLLPVVIMFLITLLPWNLRAGLNRVSVPDAPVGEEYLNLLPQVDPRDRDAFLSQYFGLKNKQYVSKFIQMNQDITILEDDSAGSNATTMLCMDKTHTFYRKYAFGPDGDKLAEQLRWLRTQQAVGKLPLCEILREGQEPGCCWYDMAYSSEAVGMFRFIHSNPLPRSRAVLHSVLDTLDADLYRPTARPASPDAVNRYLTEKVDKNLARLRESRQLRELMTYDCVRVNGMKLKNLNGLPWLWNHDVLRALFAQDPIATIHGDLTIENIICRPAERDGNETPGWYLIDPNTGNLHDSPFLDYGKLLQSLHGGYEFLMMTSRVTVQENRIDFTFTRSAAYEALFSELRVWLETHLDRRAVQSVFTHEVIHWLRLMPYKLANDKKRAPMFYAGLVLVANDVDRWYGKDFLPQPSAETTT